MILARLRFRLVGSIVAAIAVISAVQPTNIAQAALSTCSLTQLEPALGQFMVTQGVGGTGSASYATLARGKETLVKLFLTLPTSTCAVSNTQYIKITGATLMVSSGADVNTLFSSLATKPSLPATIQPASVADPIFVVPASNLVPVDGSAGFSPTFNATITYDRKSGTTTDLGKTKVFTSTQAFERKTNALRIYIVPMGDAGQPFATQYTAGDQAIVQNAMQTLSRIYPAPASIADLTGGADRGGIRYVVDTATMLDLHSLYVTSGGVTKFCGTSVNFSAIKGALAQYLLTHNTANPAATADRVVGVVGGNGSATGPISFGSEDGIGCADGMASVSSAESWIRLIADQPASQTIPAKPSRSGAIAGMEITHTFGLDKTPSFHSSAIEADAGTDRAYSISGRSRIQYDHTVMDYNNTNSPWNNDTTLFEASDFASLLCTFMPIPTVTNPLPAYCSSAGNLGTATGVASGEKYIIAGTTDGTLAKTSVVEPYYFLNVAETPESTGSLLRLIQLDRSTTPPTLKTNYGVPWSPAVTHEGAIPSAVQTFYAAAPGGFSGLGTGEVRLVKVSSPTAEPVSEVAGSTAITLFSTLKIDPPTITSMTAPIPTSGGSTTFFRSQKTPVTPPPGDVVFLADTTGSMGAALLNMRNNINSIMSTVRDRQLDTDFGAASYKDEPAFCATDPYDYRIEQPITSNATAVHDAITPTATSNSGWQTAAGQGCDKPEAQLNALYQLGTTGAGYRADSNRVIAWFGDAPGHDPSETHSESDAIAALQGSNIRVVAVNMINIGESSSLNQTGQARSIADATGGVMIDNTDPNKVAEAILNGLLSVTVTPEVNPDACSSRLTMAFDPTSQAVPYGDRASFTETATVAAETASGTYNCQIIFKINGKQVFTFQGEILVPDPDYIQDIAVVVSDQPKNDVTVTATSPQPDRLLLDLIYECNSFKFVAAIAVGPNHVTTTEATFKANLDTSNACAPFGGGGTLVPYVSDQWNRVGGTVDSNTSSTLKVPTAAIYSPALDGVSPLFDASIMLHGTLPLRGSGQIAGVEQPGSYLSWALKAPGGSSTFTPVTPVASGNSLDVPAPSPDGWAVGIWTIKLTVTVPGLAPVEATRTFAVGSFYQFIGFLSPIQNPPFVNTGKAGQSFALKWQLKSGGVLLTDTNTVASTKFAKVDACTPPSPSTHFADTSGQSVLRFDQVNMQFVFNWQTPSQPIGLYVFRLTLIDGSTHDACVNLTK